MLDRYGEAPKSVLALLDVALLRAAAAGSNAANISQRKDVLKFSPGAVFRPEALVTVCGWHKYKGRRTIAAGTPQPDVKLSRARTCWKLEAGGGPGLAGGES